AHNDVNGNKGNDTISGDAAGDTLRGGQGDDLIVGGSGADWLSGDRGHDTLTGGGGADIFHSFAGAGVSVITDFHPGEDRIQLDVGNAYQVTQQGANVVVDITGGGELVLQNTQMSSLGTGWIFEA
ncbi:MAG: hypothetical protein JWQ97_1998, partial [Phenylobacterium sp.]|nr:hypothetical protein [Phenylobacterium sp.]